jgi:hypothetical protein
MVDGNPQADVDLMQIRYGHAHNLDARLARIDLLHRIELLWVPHLKGLLKENVEEHKEIKDTDWRESLAKMRKADGEDDALIIKPDTSAIEEDSRIIGTEGGLSLESATDCVESGGIIIAER